MFTSTAMGAAFLAVFVVLSAFSTTLSQGEVAVNVNGDCRGVFYEGLGCFTRDFPFNNTYELPQNPDFVDTTFHLFTRANPHNGQPLSARTSGGQVDVGGPAFSRQLPVKVLIHGFLQNDRSPWVLEMTHSLLEHENVNVITVSWGAGAGFPYAQAVANTRVVGAELARLVRLIGQQKGVSLRRFHLIGHSLGAHVAGHAGRILRGQIARITGLDPADPNFSYQPTEVRLDSSDARWVDVIHTDGAPFTTYGGYGTLQPMGDIDFYPNGGQNQPGCHSDTSVYNFVSDAYREGMTNAEYAMACSHDRSIMLFLKSITSNCSFIAYQCASAEDFRAGECLRCGNRPCPSMGYRADMYKRSGQFYLNTLSHPPFCGYHYLVRLTLSEDMGSTNGQLHVQITGNNGHTSPLLLHQGALTAGQVVSAVMLSPMDVGHVTSATLTFTRSNSYFNWLSTSSTISLSAAKVEGVNRRNTLYFCPGSSEIQPGRPLQLRNGTRRPGNCFRG
ncbi:pancreatic lipase-related protein 2-like [Babylonia areolata]|uniref:pancreatic lipase-related protein 2-like n=1 Tax=Babylonia areolata TaxID=304850 RepID=UPI003FD2C79C